MRRLQRREEAAQALDGVLRDGAHDEDHLLAAIVAVHGLILADRREATPADHAQ